MKKCIIMLTMLMAFVIGATAQTVPAKFFDNTSVEIKGGVNTPLNGFFEGVSEQVGIQVQKDLTPWIAFALDGDFYIQQPANPHTMFDGVNINGLVKFNLFNLFGTYPGYRRAFETAVFTGVGWSHRTCKDSPLFGYRNYANYVAGADFIWNIGKEHAWALVLSPEVNWATTDRGILNKNKAMFEVNVGVVYHFKNKDGKRYFTKARLYDQAEVTTLNDKINSLIEENNKLTAQLETTPTTVTVTETVEVEKPVYILPSVQFVLNSAEISETSYSAVQEIANYIKQTPNTKYLITGYASNEGSDEYNNKLSLNRAEAMKTALVNYGVAPGQLSTYGAGITEQFSETNPSLNRVIVINSL